MSADPVDTCPVCGATPVPIVYGYPGIEMIEAERRGEVVLGGCVVWDGQPTRRCPTCGSDAGAPWD